jgi:molecular chaperone DnaK
MVYTTEKTLKDHGDKVGEDEKKKIEAAIEKVKSVQEGSDTKAIESAVEDLMQASHKLAEEMYKQKAAEQGQPAGPGDAESAPDPPAEDAKAGDEAVDADFEVVDETDDKK